MKRLLLITLFLHLPHGVAVAANELYAGEIAVLTQSEAERVAAVPEALIQVLQKISGQRELPASPELDDALSNADKLLLSFGYRSVSRIDPDGIESEELHLVARFMPTETDRLARQLELPRWQQERPPVQVWAVVDDGLGRDLKPVEFTYAWQSMEDVAAIRGLPLSWPEIPQTELPRLGLLAVPITRLYDLGTTILPSELLHQRIHDPFVIMNSRDADRMRISPGSQVRVILGDKPAGLANVEINDLAPERVLLIPRSYGLPINGPDVVEIKLVR